MTISILSSLGTDFGTAGVAGVLTSGVADALLSVLLLLGLLIVGGVAG
jgi:hypothetical protein